MSRRGRGGKNPYQGDKFTAKAKAEGYAARSVYKLEEIQRRFRLLKRGARVLDLGCHPGSWALYAVETVGRDGVVVGVDTEETRIPGMRFLHGAIEDFSVEALREALGGPANVVLSDMAPRTTGNTLGDHVRQLEIARVGLDVALALLEPGGHLVVKIFDGEEAHAFTLACRAHFSHVKRVRPEAVRNVSREFFLVCEDRLAVPRKIGPAAPAGGAEEPLEDE